MSSDFGKALFTPEDDRQGSSASTHAYTGLAGAASESSVGDRQRELLSDLQGNILEAHARNYALHLFLSFSPRRGTLSYIRSWIRGLATSRITTAWHEVTFGRRGAFCSFLLSSEGYRFLGEPMPEDTAFQIGMKGRGPRLGDPLVTQWESGYHGDIHALLILADNDPVSLARDCVREKVAAWAIGVSVVVEEPGYRLLRNGYDIEHFGYRDGISQPQWISRPRGTTLSPESLSATDIVLAEEPYSAGHFGSFLVFRKLEQNVFVWEQNIARLAAKLKADRDLVAAFAVGRFKDGTPVIASGRMLSAPSPANDFNYTADLDGNRCPLHAHIRKTNPRGELVHPESDEGYRRIARRGMSYGVRPDLHPEGRMFPLPETGVGLLFMCYQNNIERQFEYIQQVANSSDLPPHGSGPDPVIAQGESQAVANQWPVRYGSPERVPFTFDRVVTLKGGEYFFAPSIAFLRSF